MATTVGQLTIQMAADIARLRSNMDEATRTVSGAMSKIERSVGGVTKALGGIGVALSVGGVVAGLNRIVQGMDALNDAADATGASINKIAGLEAIARRNGQTLDSLTTAMIKLNAAINNIDGADSKAAVALRAIGLEAENIRQLDPADRVRAVAVALGGFANDANKAAVVQALFGKNLREIAPLLNDLAKTTGDYSVNAERAALEAEKFTKGIARLSAIVTDFLRSALLPLVSALNDLFQDDGVEDFERQLGRALGELNRLQRLGVDSADGRMQQVIGRIAELQTKLKGLREAAGPEPTKSVTDLGKLEAEATARNKAADAAKRQADEAAKLRERIAAQIADERAVLALVTQGIELDKARETVQLRRQGLTEAEIGQLQSLKGALAEIEAEQRASIEAAKEEAKAREELEANIVRQRQSAADAAADLEAQVREQLFQNETFGKTGVALALLTERRNLDRAAEIERFAEIVKGTDPALADEYLRQAAALRERAEARIAGAVQQEDADRAAEVIRKQQDEANELGKVFDQVGQSLSNSLQQAFTQGGSFLKNFIRNIKAAFLNLVVRFAVQPLLTSVAGSIAGAFGFSGAANASGGAATFGGGFLDALSGGKTAFDLISGNFTSGLSSLASSLGSAGFSSGASFVNGFASALNGGSAATFSGASSAFNLGNFAGNAAPFVPAVFSLLQGDLKGAAFSGGGAAIGTALGGPIGGIIGSTLGSLLGGLFGGSGPKAISTQAVTTLDGTSEGRAGKAGTIAGTLDGIGAINQQFLARLDGLLRSVGAESARNVSIASEIGLFDKRRRGGFNFQISRAGQELVTGANDTFGNDVKQIAEALTTELLGPALRDAFIVLAEDFVTPAVRDFLSAVETPQEIEQRIALVTSLQDAATLLNDKFGFTVEQMIELANAGADVGAVLGGLNQLVSPLEALEQNASRLFKRFSDLGVAVPLNAEMLRDMIRDIDKTTETGRELAASLAGLAPAFLQLEAARQQLLDDNAQRIGAVFGELVARRDAAAGVALGLFAEQEQAVEAAREALQSLVDGQVDAIRSSADAFDDIIRSLRDFREELTLIAASNGPFALAVSRAQFDVNANRARLGDVEAAGRLPELGRGLLTVAAEQSATREDFLRELGRVRQATEDTEAVFGRQKSIAEQQLEALQAQVSGLADVEQEVLTVEQAVRNLETARSAAESTRATLERLGVLGEQQVSIEEAIRNLESAQQAVDTATAQLEAAGLINGNLVTIQSLLNEIADLLSERERIQQTGPAAQAAQQFAETVRAAGGTTEAILAAGGANGVNVASLTGNAATIAGLYQQELGRVADAAGLAYFEGLVRGGTTIAQVADLIANSQEARVRDALGAAGQNEFNRQVNAALGLTSDIQAFATGGTFTNGIVRRPTAFNMGVMGEGGQSEAIMPLANIGGSLGVRAQTDPAMLAELRAMRQEISQLQGRLADIQDNTRRTSNAVNGRPDQPILVEMVPAA